MEKSLNKVIDCPDCGKAFYYDNPNFCPNCGYQFNVAIIRTKARDTKNEANVIGIYLIFLTFALLIWPMETELYRIVDPMERLVVVIIESFILTIFVILAIGVINKIPVPKWIKRHK